ncbi:TAXI family TRAP transporter solute-binding subunit [Treponema parvum]|uniref:TAXI family TRAP transporter solute-binding subunit n=1 Tax=Treponema parvum TaxID=138851 RepID=A0A975F4G6_9SPIR|nr:TAXI family TRAP transporter solute-binding subunit [Treponema parvum]QTQ14226.1 TAXI family TRAP transporter solute-binding subunit [Treponema parvum]
MNIRRRKTAIARTFILLLVMAVLISQGALFAAGSKESSTGEKRYDLVFFSGPLGGSWYPLAGAAAEIIQNAIPGVTVEVLPGAGLVNIEAIQAGKAALGMGNSPSTADAYQGKPPFSGPADKVRNLMSLYNLTMHMVAPAESDIYTVRDFKGKRVSAQTAGNTGEVMFRGILSAYGLSYDDFAMIHHLSHGDSANLVRDRHADVMAATMNVPGPAIMELMMSRSMRLIPVEMEMFDAIQQINAGYVPFTIKAGSYPKQDKDVLSVGMISHFAVSADLPDDLVYKIAEALYNKIDKLRAVVNTIQTDTDFMTTDIGAPMHPGANKFYDTVKKNRSAR